MEHSQGTAGPSNTHSGSIVKDRRTLRVWIHRGMSCGKLLKLLNQSARFQFIQADISSSADLQIVDWQDFHPDNNLPAQAQAEHLATLQVLPTLLIADDYEELFAVLETPSGLDHSLLEITNTKELGTSVLDTRIMKLLQSERQLSTQKLNAENSQIMLDTVMRHSNDWMVIKSLDHRFLQVSKKFCHSFGKSPEWIIGKNDLEIGTSPELVLGKSGSDWKGYWALDKEVTDVGEHVVLQPVVLEEDDHQEMRETTDKVPLRDKDGNVFGLLVCVAKLQQQKNEDLTSKDLSSDEFETLRFWETKENLEHSPALVALNNERKRVEALQHESERAFMAKNQFIAAASHDLRQPLHALGLYLGALGNKVNEDGRYLVEKLEHCVGSLNELLNSLLDISKLDANVVSAELSNFSAEELLQPLREECLSVARGKSLQFICGDDGSFLYSDPVLLRRIIRNLLMNALNNTIEGKVSLTARKLGNYVKIDVTDTGIGIPADKQELVFEEFAKLESHSQQSSQQGLGLGLSIVKRLCHLLDARIELKSTLGEGTSVSVLIPIGLSVTADDTLAQRNQLELLEMARQTKPHAMDKLILVVDDDHEVCDAVEAILKNSGYRTVASTDPHLAVETLQALELVPDAILVDFRLAENVSGLDAIDIIFNYLGIAVPTLIVTGDTTDDGLKEITESGYQHLHKPVNVDELLKVVHKTVYLTV